MSTQLVRHFTGDALATLKSAGHTTDWYRMSTRLNHLFLALEARGGTCVLLLRLCPVSILDIKSGEDTDIIPADNKVLDDNGVYAQVVATNSPAWTGALGVNAVWTNLDNTLGMYAQYSIGGVLDAVTEARYVLTHVRINK